MHSALIYLPGYNKNNLHDDKSKNTMCIMYEMNARTDLQLHYYDKCVLFVHNKRTLLLSIAVLSANNFTMCIVVLQ